MRALILGFVLLSLSAAGAAMAQPPGTPVPGCPAFMVDLREGPTDDIVGERRGPTPLPCPVSGGFVVLFETFAASPQDLHNWSDVVAFTTGGPPAPGQSTDHVWLISDVPDAAGVEDGITPDDLASIGVSVTDIVGNPTTVYMKESDTSDLNQYFPLPGDAQHVYNFFSDPAQEGPTPSRRSSWARLKLLYR